MDQIGYSIIEHVEDGEGLTFVLRLVSMLVVGAKRVVERQNRNRFEFYSKHEEGCGQSEYRQLLAARQPGDFHHRLLRRYHGLPNVRPVWFGRTGK